MPQPVEGRGPLVRGSSAAAGETAAATRCCFFRWPGNHLQISLFTGMRIAAFYETCYYTRGIIDLTDHGFLALCFMSFTLGLDIGIVMIKGVVIGVIECVTLLPAILLLFEKAIDKRRHKPLLPDFKGIAKLVTKLHWVLLVLFIDQSFSI